MSGRWKVSRRSALLRTVPEWGSKSGVGSRVSPTVDVRMTAERTGPCGADKTKTMTSVEGIST